MNLYSEITHSLSSGKEFVLATIVKSVGSTPRKSTAKMIVYPDKSISGTLGGGDFERFVIEDCLQLLELEKKCLLKKYSFSLFGKNATGMCCGGDVEVFMELFHKPHRLIVFGGGHIGKELTRVAVGSGFTTTIVDDRKDIIDSFDTTEAVLAEVDYEGKLPELDDSCFVVIVSRSHQTDFVILQSVLKSKCQYIGLIGSKAKTSKMFARLAEEGVDKKLLDTIHTPIGVDINAEGPFEIAISILAELIAVKNGK